jgi:hypothetical protein
MLRELLQRHITGGVTEAIVDRLEMVDIADQCGQRPVVPSSRGEFAIGGIAEAAQIQYARQRIHQR